MTTFGDVIEEVAANLQAYTASPDQVTALSQDLTANGLTVYVEDAKACGVGAIEIGSELMWVKQVNVAANSLSILPLGRGWRGSVATTHSAGATVYSTPALPRFMIKREINNMIESLYPDVYGVATQETVYSDVLKMAWAVPANAIAILDVRWKDYYNNWQRIRTWEAENKADLTDFPTGRCVRYWGIPQGRTVQVVYATAPVPFTAESDDYTTCGLPLGCKDLIVLGTEARMIPNLDVGRLSVKYLAADEMAQARPLGSAINVAKHIEAKYAMRLAKERAILNQTYPARVHFTR